jgi:hypothetical protein
MLPIHKRYIKCEGIIYNLISLTVFDDIQYKYTVTIISFSVGNIYNIYKDYNYTGLKITCIQNRWNWYKLPPTNLTGSGFGGLEDAYWPLVPKFAGLNPAEAVGFFRAKKSPARLPSEGK